MDMDEERARNRAVCGMGDELPKPSGVGGAAKRNGNKNKTSASTSAARQQRKRHWRRHNATAALRHLTAFTTTSVFAPRCCNTARDGTPLAVCHHGSGQGDTHLVVAVTLRVRRVGVLGPQRPANGWMACVAVSLRWLASGDSAVASPDPQPHSPFALTCAW